MYIMEILWNCNPLKKTSDKKKSERVSFLQLFIYVHSKGKKKYLRSFIIYDSHLSDEMSQYFNLIH